MKTLAVTGGMGCGKSYIVNVFSRMGIPVYCADDRTKDLYCSDEALRHGLSRLLDMEIVVDGVLRSREMAERIFIDPSLLEKVEALVHPAVCRDFQRWRGGFEGKGTAFVIIESAIFLEKPLMAPLADKVLTVSSPLELRKKRIVMRDGISEASIDDRLSRQWSDEEREAKADFIVISDGQHALLPQITDVFEKMK